MQSVFNSVYIFCIRQRKESLNFCTLQSSLFFRSCYLLDVFYMFLRAQRLDFNKGNQFS